MQEQSLGLTSARKKDSLKSGKKKQLIKREPVEGTPFTIITMDKKSFITVGAYRLSEETTNKEELLRQIENKDWTLTTNVISMIAEQVIALREKQ